MKVLLLLIKCLFVSLIRRCLPGNDITRSRNLWVTLSGNPFTESFGGNFYVIEFILAFGSTSSCLRVVGSIFNPAQVGSYLPNCFGT